MTIAIVHINSGVKSIKSCEEHIVFSRLYSIECPLGSELKNLPTVANDVDTVVIITSNAILLQGIDYIEYENWTGATYDALFGRLNSGVYHLS